MNIEKMRALLDELEATKATQAEFENRTEVSYIQISVGYATEDERGDSVVLGTYEFSVDVEELDKLLKAYDKTSQAVEEITKELAEELNVKIPAKRSRKRSRKPVDEQKKAAEKLEKDSEEIKQQADTDLPIPELEEPEVLVAPVAVVVPAEQVEEAAPVVEEEAPVTEEEAAPVVEEEAPVAEEEAAPVVEEEAAPVVEEEAPKKETKAKAKKSPKKTKKFTLDTVDNFPVDQSNILVMNGTATAAMDGLAEIVGSFYETEDGAANYKVVQDPAESEIQDIINTTPPGNIVIFQHLRLSVAKVIKDALGSAVVTTLVGGIASDSTNTIKYIQDKHDLSANEFSYDKNLVLEEDKFEANKSQYLNDVSYLVAPLLGFAVEEDEAVIEEAKPSAVDIEV